jgi:hypothetical protein
MTPTLPGTGPGEAARFPESTQAKRSPESLDTTSDERNEPWAALIRRGAVGLGMAAVYGLVLGLRHGGTGLVAHTLGVPFALFLVALLGVPSLFVFLSLCQTPIDARSLASIAARSLGSAGLLLFGLAPAAALFVVTSETSEAAAGAVTVGLLLGGGVSLFGMISEVTAKARGNRANPSLRERSLILGFGLFAVMLVTRVWTSLLPILGGAS